MEEISGYIEDIIFSSSENGFTVAKFKEEKQNELICIVGTLLSVQPGEALLLKGEWKKHPQFGKQFEIASYEVTSPSTLVGIQKYLESGLIKGIGPVYAKKIIDFFGLDTLDIIDEKPDRLIEIPGIGKKKVETIKTCWLEQKSVRDVMIFLRTYGVSPAYAQKIYKRYEDKSIELVKENPYRLAKDIFGIGFKIADSIAERMGFEKTSAFRIDAGIEFTLWELSSDGHTCIPEEKLTLASATILDVDTDLIDRHINQMVKEQKVIRKNLSFDDQTYPFIWLNVMHHYEEGIALELARLQNNSSSIRSINADKALEWVEKQLNIKLEDKQKDGVRSSIEEKLHIITGGPGTGKSTITKAILAITEKLTSKITLAAPTGRAAKRMSQITRKKASTIHSLLEYDFRSGSFRRNPDSPLSCRLIIIDEASMIDTSLMYNLLRALPNDTRVILIGDIDQLPSVGPGNILKDVIASEKVSMTKLTEIFRQAKGSKIILNAHRINQGEFPYIPEKEKSDFFFLEAPRPEEIQQKALQMIKEDIPKKWGFDPIDDIQLLSPMKKGLIGIENFNTILQTELNPSDSPFYRTGMRLHVNDKVMQIRNNYTKLIFNGDVGRISKIDKIEQEIVVTFDGRDISYDFSELDEITLAYAVSVHKYQGSECPCIVMPLHMSHFILLYRNLLYTAVTRGRRLVVLIGSKKALAVAIKNIDVRQRFTGLKEAILETYQNKKIASGLFPTF